MEEETKGLEQEKPKPFNHVLEVQDGVIDLRDLFKRIDKKIEEDANGKVSA
jgi:hypothetical protein